MNLGADTDTVGVVTGGLAVLYYGFDKITDEWIDLIIRKDYIIEMCLHAEEKFKIR